MCTNLVLGVVQLYGVFILVSDYVRMEVTIRLHWSVRRGTWSLRL